MRVEHVGEEVVQHFDCKEGLLLVGKAERNLKLREPDAVVEHHIVFLALRKDEPREIAGKVPDLSLGLRQQRQRVETLLDQPRLMRIELGSLNQLGVRVDRQKDVRVHPQRPADHQRAIRRPPADQGTEEVAQAARQPIGVLAIVGDCVEAVRQRHATAIGERVELAHGVRRIGRGFQLRVLQAAEIDQVRLP